ncbi:secreted RxLR effector protein 161-like [Phragmites australis]|uniref:secreted RxLR effector protein 161-like n=1 Tax=Phragmites australis TaxID=29695 RepID=UPI002D7768BB|nr:secreted RxLR effector protein 161-like [Phragmites australis]
MREFKMSDLSLLSFYLGIGVRQSPKGITLSQATHAEKILSKVGMEGCNPTCIPMESHCMLSQVSSAPLTDATTSRSIISSLCYLVHTCLDISFSAGYLSRFMESLTTEHLTAVKKILRYIVGTLHFGCCYSRKTKEARLIGYFDSDLVGDVDTRKSKSRVFFFLGSSPISWQSLNQKVVALSSCEAEYIAGAMAACQGIWLGRLLGELKNAESEPFVLKIDN